MLFEAFRHDHAVDLWNQNHHRQRKDVEHVRFVKRRGGHQNVSHHHGDDEGIEDDQPHGRRVGPFLAVVLHGVERFDAKVSTGPAFFLLGVFCPITFHALGLRRRHGRFEVHHVQTGTEQVLEHIGSESLPMDPSGACLPSDFFKEGRAHRRDRPGWRSW